MTKQKQQTSKMLLIGLFWTITTSISAFAYQQETAQEVDNSSRNTELLVSSVGQKKTDINIALPVNPTIEQRKSYWKKNKHPLLSQSMVSPKPISLGKTRQEHLLLKQAQKQANKQQLKAVATTKESNFILSAQGSFNHYDSFSIYDAFSYLLDDIDGDGYYQSFSIVFDADFYTSSYIDHANVYAEVYLSKDGGPWTHYYSTDIFTIFGESDADEYEVMTTLEQGFSSGYYDVLIDLYDADYDELVVSYSSDDNNALYALPLESNDLDQPYVTEIIHTHGGSSSALFLLFIALAIFIRQQEYL